MEFNRSFYKHNITNNHNYSDYYTENSMSPAHKVLIYLFAAVAAIGLTGNTLSFSVMLRKQMRKTSTSIYLIILSIFDNIVLFDGIVLNILLPSPLFLEYVLVIENKATCKIITLVEYIAPHVSVWCLVLVTTERLLVIYYPHRYVCAYSYF